MFRFCRHIGPTMHLSFFFCMILANDSLTLNGTNSITYDPVVELQNMSQRPTLFEKFGSKLKLKLPDPYDIETIKPNLVFYRNGLKYFEVKYDADPRDVAVQLKSAGYLDTERLIVITHGFHNNFNTDWLHTYKDTILNVSSSIKKEQTVAILGWGGGADLVVIFYRNAAANVVPVGQWLANYTKAINDVKPSLPIYGVGHSLGAHLMGVAGRQSKVFDRITGLDPAGPCFEKVPNSESLTKTDAKFVDVIHTDGFDSKLDPEEWFFPVNHYGCLVPIATLDFYPNFGYHQPGAGTFTVAGSHLRSIDLYKWSIENPGKFVTSLVLADTPDYEKPVLVSKATEFKAEMGYYADKWNLPPPNASTLYFLKTNKEEPWAL